MSLAIEASRVTGVLVGGSWLSVKAGTFVLDAFELIEEREHRPVDPVLLYNGGTGWSAESRENGRLVGGPIGLVQAVEWK